MCLHFSKVTWVLARKIVLWLSTNTFWGENVSSTHISLSRLLIQRISFVVRDKATYSIFVEDKAVVDCFLLDQEIGAPVSSIMYPL